MVITQKNYDKVIVKTLFLGENFVTLPKISQIVIEEDFVEHFTPKVEVILVKLVLSMPN